MYKLLDEQPTQRVIKPKLHKSNVIFAFKLIWYAVKKPCQLGKTGFQAFQGCQSCGTQKKKINK